MAKPPVTPITKYKFRLIELNRTLDSREDVARFILINSKVANNDGWGKYNLTSTGVLLNTILSTADEDHLARIAPAFGIEVAAIPVEQQAAIRSFGVDDELETTESAEAKAVAKAAKPGQFAKKT